MPDKGYGVKTAPYSPATALKLAISVEETTLKNERNLYGNT